MRIEMRISEERSHVMKAKKKKIKYRGRREDTSEKIAVERNKK